MNGNTLWTGGLIRFVCLVAAGLRVSCAQAQSAPPVLDSLDPNANGAVRCLAMQPDGKILLGGEFTTLGGQPRKYLGRLNADGSLDADFTVGADGVVLSLAVQTDARIIVAGEFLNLGGQARSRIARLNANGTLDASFRPLPNGVVRSVLVQPGGNVLIGGSFSIIGGQTRGRIARLNADGSLDASFNPGASDSVYSLALQPDGKILLAGGFATLAGQARARIGRLNADGSLDTSFNPSASSMVWCLMLQADGRILVGGAFAAMCGVPRSRIGRLLADGNLDGAFNPGANNTIYSMAALADGTVVAGGAFTTLAGQPRNRLARFKADGSLDSAFDPGADSFVQALGVQADGRILAGGVFSTLNGQGRGGLGRLSNLAAATQGLTLDGSTVTWTRGGGSPELAWVTFAASTNGGTSWTELGAGGRVPGGWQLSGAPVFSNSVIRARGLVAGGGGNGSCWHVERIQQAVPRIVVQPEDVFTNATAGMILRASAEGVPPLSWQWMKDGVELGESAVRAGARSNVLRVASAVAADSGAYSVRVSNAFGGDVSQLARVMVVDPLILVEPASQEVFVGRPAVFGVTAAGTAPLSYQWRRDGAALAGAWESQLVVTNVDLSDDGGRFQVVISSVGGSVTSAVAVLTAAKPAAPDAFCPAPDGTVWALAVQKDGAFLAGGDFTMLAGEARSYVGRFEADGRLDSGFAPRVNAPTVDALMVQEDGAILAGGTFGSLGGVARSRLGRVYADGTVDAGFNPGANNQVWTFALQPDGKIVVGGAFPALGGVSRNHLGRLNRDGSVDAGFPSAIGSTVYALAVQPDGKILYGGSGVGRLLPDATGDVSFSAGCDSTVYALALQAGGKILIGGSFSTVGGKACARIARLLADGRLDTSFTAAANDVIYSFAVQADGRVIVGGAFTTLNGQNHRGLGRLNPDGSLDPTFTPETDGTVYAVALQPDGDILAGGTFTNLGGCLRPRLGRVSNTVRAFQRVVIDGDSVTWLRGLSAPEISWAVFDISVDGGNSWTNLGAGERISGGWRMAGVAIPPGASVRARGPASSGCGNGSGGFVETMVGRPVFSLQPQAAFTNVGAAVVFCAQAAGSEPLSWQWRKDGVDLAEGGRFSGVQSRVLTITGALAQDQGAYSVVVSNAFGWVESTAADLVLADPLITLAPVSQAVVAGGSAEFRVQAGGTAPLSYQWLRGGVAVPGATNEVLSVLNVQWADDGAPFSVVAASPFGSVTSSVARLTVMAAPAEVKPAFASADYPVRCLAFQRDGKLLAGGEFYLVGNELRWGLARFEADGTLDAGFVPAAYGRNVLALAVDADDRVLVAGDFRRLAGMNRSGLGRLNDGGLADASFNPAPNATVRALLPEPGGTVWVAGWFTVVAGQARNGIARIHSDGSLDASVTAGADGPVLCLARQDDGKILVGGSFTNLCGQPRNGLGRLNPDGSLDASFNPQADGSVWCLAVQADGRILAGGAFVRLAGTARIGLGRLNSDGTLDAGFDAQADAPAVNSIALQADGRIVVGGEFGRLGRRAQSGLGRLHPDGSVDVSFPIQADKAVYAVGVGPDGSIIAGGAFATVGGQPRLCLARVSNTVPALQTLEFDGARVSWMRGGSAPEMSWAGLDVSTNGGGKWDRLGAGTRVSGGWEFSGLEIPTGASLRVNGWVAGGSSGGSGWCVEAGAGAPFILAPLAGRAGVGGGDVVFDAGMAGTAPLSYQWYRNGLAMEGAVGAALTLTNLQWTDDGSQFQVVAANSAGRATSAVAALTVVSPPGILTRGPYIMMGHFTNQSTVVWRTAVPLDSWVDYGLTPAYGLTAGSSSAVLQHEVALTGLAPGQAYYYRIQSGGGYLASALFRSGKLPGAPMRVVWTGDHQIGTGGALARVIKNCQPDLVLHTGDSVNYCGTAPLDEAFFPTYGCVLKESPSYWTPGNHEGNNCAASLEAFDLLPEDHQSYSIEYGNLQAIALNSQALPSTNWLRAKLAESGKPWRVAFSHYPMYTAAGGHGDADGATLRASHLPLLEEYKVNVVVAGHNHYYWRSLPIQGIHFYVVGSAGSPPYTLGALPSYTAAATDTVDAFAYADIQGDIMHIHTLNAAGVQIDEAVIDRQCAFQLDGLLDPAAVLVGSRPGGLPLYAAVSGRYLYVATAPAVGNDHFVVLSRTASSTMQSFGPAWQKSGVVMAHDAVLSGNGSNAINGWFDANGAPLTDLRAARSATRYDKTGFLEGVIDLQALYGEIPPVLYLAAAPFAAGAGGSLVEAQQFPAGNGNGSIEPEEFLAVTTREITRAAAAAVQLGLVLNPSGGVLDLSGPPNTACDLEVSMDLAHWAPVARGITSATGRLQFTDPAAGGSQTRFYRARQVAP